MRPLLLQGALTTLSGGLSLRRIRCPRYYSLATSRFLEESQEGCFSVFCSLPPTLVGTVPHAVFSEVSETPVGVD